MRLALLALVLAAGSARAGIWQAAIDRGQPDPAQDIYTSEMKSGDRLAREANSHGSASMANVRSMVEHAAMSYRNAADAKPTEGEPYFRLGLLLYSFYFECQDALQSPNTSPLCNSSGFDRKHAQEVIDAWDAFEARAPLDPRLSVQSGSSEVLFRRAILHTKLLTPTTKDHLLAAARDYEKIIARSDTDDADDRVMGNLAETYMMLDRLDEAIDMYREAIRRGASTSTVYGLAVALDRDERSDQARELIVSQGRTSLDSFRRSVTSGESFFVPPGEQYYYVALASEAFDMDDDAIDYWQSYIRSGAHAEFQPRAKAHLEALLAQRKRSALRIPQLLPREIFR